MTSSFALRYWLMVVATLALPQVVSTSPPGRRLSIASHLLSLLRSGDVTENEGPEVDGAARSNPDEADHVVKSVIDMLTTHRTANGVVKNSPMPLVRRPLTSDALEGLNALLTGAAKTPAPINLSRQHPAEAAIDYFSALGITSDECRMRTICELLVEPQASYGVFGELISYVFGGEEPDKDTINTIDRERYKKYHAAAVAGRHMHNCEQEYAACATSYKDYVRLVNL